MITYEDRVSRKGLTAREAAKRAGMSTRSAQRWTSRPREEYIAEMAAEREAIRRFHDDEGNSWTETAAHFGLHLNTVKQRAYRARKERAAEREAAAQAEREESEPPLFDAK